MLEFLNKFEFLNKIFRLGETRHTARERLRLVLIHDRASVSPEIMESLKGDLIGIISKYLEIDVSAIEIGLEKHDGSIALAANIPIRRVRRQKDSKVTGDQKGEAVSREPAPAKAPAIPETAAHVERTVQSEISSQGTKSLKSDEESKGPSRKVVRSRSIRKKRASSRTKRKSKMRHS